MKGNMNPSEMTPMTRLPLVGTGLVLGVISALLARGLLSENLAAQNREHLLITGLLFGVRHLALCIEPSESTQILTASFTAGYMATGIFYPLIPRAQANH